MARSRRPSRKSRVRGRLTRISHKPSAATCGRQAGTALGLNRGSDSMHSYSPPPIPRPPCPSQPRAASRDEACERCGLAQSGSRSNSQILSPRICLLTNFSILSNNLHDVDGSISGKRRQARVAETRQKRTPLAKVPISTSGWPAWAGSPKRVTFSKAASRTSCSAEEPPIQIR
jgi:hypothetical protein